MNQSYIHFVEDVVGRKSKEVAGGRQTLDGIQTVSTAGSAKTAGDDF